MDLHQKYQSLKLKLSSLSGSSVDGLTLEKFSFFQLTQLYEDFLVLFNQREANEIPLPELKEGSIVLTFALPLAVATAFQNDIVHLKEGEYQVISSQKIKVFQKWDRLAMKEHFQYDFALNDEPLLTISQESRLPFVHELSRWITMSKIIQGKIIDAGGKKKSNVHLLLENGDVMKIFSDEQTLSDEKNNYIYKDRLLKVKYKYNVITGEEKDFELDHFIQQKKWDEKAFDTIWSKSSRQWADVGNGNEWVQEMRGEEDLTLR